MDAERAPRLADVARERIAAEDALRLPSEADAERRVNALRRTREVLDRAADDFARLLALELPDPVRQGVVATLRQTAGLEALAEALAEGTVHEGQS